MCLEEVALYDRQIRLWGMEAQTRMRNSNILVINAGALANEIIKNIVLAGIGSLTVLDSHTVSAEDLGAQFFVSDADIGKNRAEAALSAIKSLNPRVNTSTASFPIQSKGSEWYSQFDAVIGTQLDYTDISYIDNTIRANETKDASNTAFFATSVTGFYGTLFTSLGSKFTYTVEQERSTSFSKLRPGPQSDTTTLLSITPATRKEGKTIYDTLCMAESYISYNHLMNATTLKIAGFDTPKKSKKVSPLVPILLGYWELQKMSKDQSSQFTVEQLKDATLSQIQRLNLPHSVLTEYLGDDMDGDELIETYLSSQGAEISPIAAILGGVVGQQVLNVIAKRSDPLQNILVFNGIDGKGPVYSIV